MYVNDNTIFISDQMVEWETQSITQINLIGVGSIGGIEYSADHLIRYELHSVPQTEELYLTSLVTNDQRPGV